MEFGPLDGNQKKYEKMYLESFSPFLIYFSSKVFQMRICVRLSSSFGWKAGAYKSCHRNPP